MDPRALIETYVDDVSRRLPRRLRSDVALELRALLEEELAGKAEAAGRPADEAMALALLRGFGAPADVADRYRPAGFTIIRPADAPGFALTALVGVALQWAISLPMHFAHAGSANVALQRLGAWWLSLGLGAFWWPGLLITITIIAAWARDRWRRDETWTPVRVIDRDRVSRGWLGLALAFWIAGASFWVGFPWLLEQAPAAVAAALRMDPSFLNTRAPWVLPLWAAHFVLYGYVIWVGRWTRTTRRLNTAASLAICLLLVWFLAAGPMFVAASADRAARLILGLIVVVSLAAETWRFAGDIGRGRPPDRARPAAS